MRDVSVARRHVNALVVFLNIRSRSSHSVLEKGTTLSAPDIKLSVYAMTVRYTFATEYNNSSGLLT